MTYRTLEAAPRLSGVLSGIDAREGLLIGGAMRAASDHGSFDVVDPACGEPFATVADATLEDARAAVDAASPECILFTLKTALSLPVVFFCVPSKTKFISPSAGL